MRVMHGEKSFVVLCKLLFLVYLLFVENYIFFNQQEFFGRTPTNFFVGSRKSFVEAIKILLGQKKSL